MTREEAFAILTRYLKNINLQRHCLATEATMKALYNRLNNSPYNQQEEEKWGNVGLLHDADYEMARGKPEVHGMLLFEKESTIPPDIAYAIKAHNFEYTKVQPINDIDWAITACDQLTGLIVAAALIHPTSPSGGPAKKLAPLTADFVLNRFNDKTFAKGATRETILLCESKLGIPLKEFIDITLKAMQSINTELGL